MGILGDSVALTGFTPATSVPPVSTIPPMLRRHFHLDTNLDQKGNRQVLELSKDAVLRVGRVMDKGLKYPLKF